MKKELDMSLFTNKIDPPKSRFSEICINIYGDGKFNLNGNLTKVLGGKIVGISFTSDCKHICIEENPTEKGIKLPKNGSMKLLDAVELLKKHNIRFPAKYQLCYCEKNKVWQGEYFVDPMKRSFGKSGSLKKN